MSKTTVGKKTRNRIAPAKKWTETETRKILDYVLANGPLEKPTARIYYQKLTASTNIEVRWTLIKQKLRYLKDLYHKAANYLEQVNATDAAQSSPGEDGIKEHIKKICPHFAQLQLIYGEAKISSWTGKDAEEQQKDCAVGELALGSAMAMERMKQQEQCETEHNLRHSQLQLDWERLKFERYKFDKEFELQKMQQQLKQKELEQRERLALYELKLKYGGEGKPGLQFKMYDGNEPL